MTSSSSAELKARTVRVGPVVVCAFTGDLLMDNEAVAVAALDGALGLGPAVLAVDLSGVELCTSAGLSLLLTVRRTAHDRGVPLVLVAPGRGVRRVLEVTETGSLFPVFATVEQAARAHARGNGRGPHHAETV
ncbi:STAS domain-containing protein [Kitasatospora sp. NPDC085895]|uniref:STAS domain-containing protein n=1 Tax=Kitasatospora sp. NPDC085895 TaxID=3155057 RepID=UPI00344E2426